MDSTTSDKKVGKGIYAFIILLMVFYFHDLPSVLTIKLYFFTANKVNIVYTKFKYYYIILMMHTLLLK